MQIDGPSTNTSVPQPRYSWDVLLFVTVLVLLGPRSNLSRSSLSLALMSSSKSSVLERTTSDLTLTEIKEMLREWPLR